MEQGCLFISRTDFWRGTWEDRN